MKANMHCPVQTQHEGVADFCRLCSMDFYPHLLGTLTLMFDHRDVYDRAWKI